MSARIAILSATVAALALAAGTAAAPPVPGPGQITAGTGCSVQCVLKALVTATTSYANVAIETSVPTKIAVIAWRPSQGGPDATFHSSAFATHRSVFLSGLKPDTTYQILVKATDAQGRSDSRHGSFKTRKVETAVDTGIGNIKSNVGCSIQCVRKALFTNVGGTDATIAIETGEPAQLQVMLSPDAPIQESWGPRFSFVERSVSSQGLVTKWTGQLGQLRPGTKYHVIVSATDAQGQSAYQTGTVQMDDRKVRITLLKIKVISDADKGSANKGEIKFDHTDRRPGLRPRRLPQDRVGGDHQRRGTRRASGRARGARREWNRPGVHDAHRRCGMRLAAAEVLRSRERLDPPGRGR